jgi:hypothetical protein
VHGNEILLPQDQAAKKHLLLEQAGGYVKALEKSTSSSWHSRLGF